jgi:hypothetical protein
MGHVRITINFGKENITYKCLQVVGKSHIDIRR